MTGIVQRVWRDDLRRGLEETCDELETIMRAHHTPPEIARIVTDAYNAVIRARQVLDDQPHYTP